MGADLPSRGLRVVSTARSSGELVVELQDEALPRPGPGQVLIQVEAAPINPSDLLRMFGHLDPTASRFEGTPERPRIVAAIPPEGMRAFAARLDTPAPIGNEGAGRVAAAGAGAEALVGQRVAVRAPGMYATHQLAAAADCLTLPDDVTAAEGASCFINPLTVLGMLETLRLEGYSGLVHTAAASNLGQMLVKACLEDGVPLVNIVRKPEQAKLLRGLGAAHVCDSSAPTFHQDLVRALDATGATLAFDAIGGGRMANRILTAMEQVALSHMAEPSPYGAPTRKQVYVYGVLDPSPIELTRSYGWSWGVGGWLLWDVMERVGPARVEALRQRVRAGLKTTFASGYSRTVSLAGALQRDVIEAAARHATGDKILIEPAR